MGEYDVSCHPECVALADAIERHWRIIHAEQDPVPTRAIVGRCGRTVDRIHRFACVDAGRTIEGPSDTGGASMGGKPSKGTPKDKRLGRNKPKA